MGGVTCILGAGVTGLAAGIASGFPVFEAGDVPGGICSSYYMRPSETKRLYTAPADGDVYRFEMGGGHWVFDSDLIVLNLLRSLAPLKSYARHSSVYLRDMNLFVSYPIQNHLHRLGAVSATKIVQEMIQGAFSNRSVFSMADWQLAHFGPTLCELFFDPFHELYSAGLWKWIMPQDDYKSPVNLSQVIQGVVSMAAPVGYNVTFVYPIEGLNAIVQRMAEKSTIHYQKRVVGIDVKYRRVHFADGSGVDYETVLSTLPLNRTMDLAGLKVDSQPDPCTSVLVVNVGAVKGPRCPQDHWVYIPRSQSRFHRVGFYSNVDESFLPVSVRRFERHVSLYIEKAYQDGQKPDDTQVRNISQAMVRELQDWEWIDEPDVVDATWIDVAYTWSWVGSQWKREALRLLDQNHVIQVGRFARWVFQGIGDSIRDGLMAGAALAAKKRFRRE